MDDWGERTRPACRFGRRARNIVGQISLLTGFRRDAENGNRDGRAPRERNGRTGRTRKQDGLVASRKAGRKGTLFLNSFWDGRPGQVAFESRRAQF
jgi:hypothetical protein